MFLKEMFISIILFIGIILGIIFLPECAVLLSMILVYFIIEFFSNRKKRLKEEESLKSSKIKYYPKLNLISKYKDDF